MCFFNPKIESKTTLPEVKKANPNVAQAELKTRKLQDAEDVTKSVKFGDTARAASTAKSVGASDLKININQNKTGTKTGGMNLA
jgi:hypothetical protein